MKKSRLKRSVKHPYRIRLKHGTDPDWKFNPVQLAMGVKVELEHTNSRDVAKQIAKAHLAENPSYYTYLSKMERSMK